MLHGTGANGTDRALSAATAFQELQAEYDKFRGSSNQLEIELEEELSRTQKRARASEDKIWRGQGEQRAQDSLYKTGAPAVNYTYIDIYRYIHIYIV